MDSTKIIIHSQAEYDNIPTDYEGTIVIDSKELITIHSRKNVEVQGNSIVKAYGNSTVYVNYRGTVMAYDSSTAFAYHNSTVCANDDSTVKTFDNSMVKTYDNGKVFSYNNSIVYANDCSVVKAHDNSTVYTNENSQVKANGNVQIVNYKSNENGLEIHANARIVYPPKTPIEFVEFYGLESSEDTAKFYKAVHKTETEGVYCSNHNVDFKYKIGEIKTEECNTDVESDCAKGIHISAFYFAYNFGKDWRDMAIIEVESKLSDIVVPRNSNGKIRTSRVKVLREVPKEEWEELM